MTTAEATQQRGSGCGLVILLGLGFLVLMLVLSAGMPALNDHAQNKHGQAAVDAWQYISDMPGRNRCRWRCGDGRDRYVCNIKGTDDWAIAVVEKGNLITAFVATHDYAKHVIDEAGCNANPLHFSHP